MAEDNQNNQSSPGNDSADASKAQSGSANSATSSYAGAANSGAVSKKPKTEKQIVRERERRRRRRKKKAEIKGLGGEKVLRPGDDVPLVVIKEGKETDNLQPPEDNQIVETPAVKVEADNIPADVPLILPEQEAPKGPSISAPPEPPSEVPLQPEEEPLDQSQQIFEESPGYSEDSPAQPENDNLIEAEPPVHEEHFEKNNQDKARELHESLFTDQHDHLEELPVKQGLLGKFFDKFAELVQGRKTQGLPSGMNKTTETMVTEVSTEKPDVSGISSFLANLIKFVLVIALVIGAFWLGSSLKVVDRLSGLFAGGKPGEQLAVGDNSQVVIDPQMMQKWGFDTARLIGSNLGDSNDLTYNIFFNADYFGKLKDPIFYGETGISAAIYYGFGKEVQYVQNRFINYVHYLSSVVNANAVKIEDVMKTNARRDIALDNYLKQSQVIFDQGNTLRKEINVQIDDLKVSINTLAPDKTRYETDFFASMAVYDGGKANALLAQFIGASQKNVELTAKQNALQKLTQSYETELLILKTRIQAVQANRDALISGVAFTEVTGGGINLITQ